MRLENYRTGRKYKPTGAKHIMRIQTYLELEMSPISILYLYFLSYFLISLILKFIVTFRLCFEFSVAYGLSYIYLFMHIYILILFIHIQTDTKRIELDACEPNSDDTRRLAYHIVLAN